MTSHPVEGTRAGTLARTLAGTLTRNRGVRWRILALFVGLSFMNYLVRMNISVAAKFMMPELGISAIQMGWVFSSFMLTYAALQIPSGILGDRWGPRKVLGVAAFSWGILTFLTGLVPGLILTTALGSLVALIVLRLLLGCVEAPTYPVGTGLIAAWFPTTESAFGYSLVITGLYVGSAFTPPLVSWLMVTVGWRESFYITAMAAVAIAILWERYLTDRPEDHRKVGAAELAKISRGRRDAGDAKVERRVWRELLRRRDIRLLALSHFCSNYVFYIFIFWLFIYMVDERGFTILRGGLFTGMPFLVAAVMAPLGGRTCDGLVKRIGPRWGRRLVVQLGLLLSAGFLVLGAIVENPYLAVAALSLCVGCASLTQGVYWATVIDISGRHSATAAGIMNTGGNLGGVVSTAVVPVLVGQVGWMVTLAATALLAVVSAFLWFGIRADHRFDAVPAAIASLPKTG